MAAQAPAAPPDRALNPPASYPKEAGLPTFREAARPGPAETERERHRLHVYFALMALAGTPFENSRAGGGWGWGVGIFAGAAWDRWPLLLGIDIAPTFYGTMRGDLQWDDGNTVHRTGMRVRDVALMADLWLRVQPGHWSVRPYMEGVAGFKVISTERTYDLWTDHESSEESSGQVARSLGFGAGLDCTLKETPTHRLYLVLGFRWLRGGDVRFGKHVRGAQGQTGLIEATYSTTTTLLTLGIAAEADFLPR